MSVGKPSVSPQKAAHPESIPPRRGTLEYAPRALRPRHSFYGVLAFVMAGVSVLWLGYVHSCLGTPPHWQLFNPIWVALYDHYECPGEIGIALAVVGLIQNSRKRTLSLIAVIVIVVAYALLLPPGNFA